jgi:hypothetical protein
VHQWAYSGILWNLSTHNLNDDSNRGNLPRNTGTPGNLSATGINATNRRRHDLYGELSRLPLNCSGPLAQLFQIG